MSDQPSKTEYSDNLIEGLRLQTLHEHKRLTWPGEEEMKAFAQCIWSEAFARGYERGKKDERDAIQIDEDLKLDGLDDATIRMETC